MSAEYDWRPRLGSQDLRVLDAALAIFLDSWEGPWTKDAVIAEALLERVRHARVQAERSPKARIAILEGRR
jgi:hypothetical protein